MIKATSSHFLPALPGAEEHNERKKQLDYVRKDLTHLNKTWKADNFVSVDQARRDVAEKYKAAHGKKLPKNATPIQETVVVISSDTTMEQLQHLANSIEDIWGFRPLAIYAHLDEGHSNSKTWKPNLHAHLIFDTTDSRGETLKPISEKMRKSEQSKWEKKEAALAEKEGREPRKFFPPDSWKKPAFDYMQDLTAKCLDMKRGTSSSKKHLDAIQFKTQMEERRLNAVIDEVEKLNVTKARKEAAVATAKAVGEAIKGLVGQSSKDKEIKALKAIIESEPERTAAAVATAKAEERQQVLSEVKKAANLCIKEKNGRETAEDIGKAWRRRFREVSELESNLKSIRANIKTQIESATDEYRRRAERAEERAELWKDRFLDVWPTAEKAIAAIVEKVNSSWQRFFTPEQVKDIQAAMESAVDTEDRIERGKQLMEYARPEFTKCELNTAEQVEDIAINSSNVRTQSIGRSI